MLLSVPIVVLAVVHVLKMSLFRLAVRSAFQPRLASAALPATRFRVLQQASYSAAAGLNKEQITPRVLAVLKGFEKVDPAKVRVEVCSDLKRRVDQLFNPFRSSQHHPGSLRISDLIASMQ